MVAPASVAAMNSQRLLLVPLIILLAIAVVGCGGRKSKKTTEGESVASLLEAEEEAKADAADAAADGGADGEALDPNALPPEVEFGAGVEIVIVPGVGYTYRDEVVDLKTLGDALRRAAKFNRYLSIQIRTGESADANTVGEVLNLTQKYQLVNVRLSPAR